MKIVRILFATLLTCTVAACASPSPQREQFAKEQTACARLGIDPGTPAFSQCVANLDATMFDLSAVAAR